MISVMVTTKDQVSQVEPSIRALLAQDFSEDYEIIVIDDGSTDGTLGQVSRLFGERIRAIGKEAPDGWLKSLSIACQEAKGDLLAVCDPHCMVKTNWLQVVAESFSSDPGLCIMTGTAFHGYRFMQKLSALTSHAQFLSAKRGFGSHIFDDNFAIKRDTLAQLLSSVPVERNVNDAVGCALLSSETRREGIPVLYEPQMAALHVSPGFIEYLREWRVINAETSIDIRLMDPNARGAALSKYLILAPFIYPCVRILLDIRNAWHFRRVLRLRTIDFPLILTADVIGKMWYCAGLIKAIKSRRLNRLRSK